MDEDLHLDVVSLFQFSKLEDYKMTPFAVGAKSLPYQFYLLF